MRVMFKITGLILIAIAMLSGCGEEKPDPLKTLQSELSDLKKTVVAQNARHEAGLQKIRAEKAKGKSVVKQEIPVTKQPEKPKPERLRIVLNGSAVSEATNTLIRYERYRDTSGLATFQLAKPNGVMTRITARSGEMAVVNIGDVTYLFIVLKASRFEAEIMLKRRESNDSSKRQW